MKKPVVYYIVDFEGYVEWVFSGLYYYVDRAYINKFLSIYSDAKEAC